MFALYASDALGIFMSALFISDDSDKDDFLTLVVVQTIIAITVHLLVCVFFRGAPLHPPR